MPPDNHVGPTECVLPYMIEYWAERAPDRDYIGVVGQGWRTFRTVHDNARGWAAKLAGRGVERGDRVATFFPTSFESVEVWAGISWLGAIEVPVHTELRGSMLSHVLSDSGARVAVVAPDLADVLLSVAAGLTDLELIVVTGAPRAGERRSGQVSVVDQAALGTVEGFDGCRELTIGDIAAIMYTSGTTGASKGVIQPWGQYEASMSGIFPDASSADCFYTPLPIHHKAGRSTIYRMAASGGRVLMRPRFSVSDYWADIRAGGCTLTLLMGSMAAMLWNSPPRPDDATSPLRAAVMSPLIPQAREYEKRFGLSLRTNFGMTECSEPIVGGAIRPLVNLTSCGRQRDGYEVRVVDRLDRPLGPGNVGELVVRTDQPWKMCLGYWQNPQRSLQAYRNLWFHTGDHFRYDEDGNFYFVDRANDVIRRRGENISSYHLEREIVSHPAVSECAVIGFDSELGDQEILALVIPEPGSTTTLEELHGYLEPRVARFMLPRYWSYVDDFPRTQTMRIQKGELRAAGIEPQLDVGRHRSGPSTAVPAR